MTVRQAADRAGVAWSTQSRAEDGDPNLGLVTMCAIGEAVGLDVVITVYEGRRPSLRDTGQLTIVERLCGEAHPIWQPAAELLVGQHGEAIDTAFFGPAEIIASEVERLASDFQGQYRRADRKRQLLAERHQRPVRLVLVIEDTRANRRALEPHLEFIRSVLPADSRGVLRGLRSGKPLGRDGLLWRRRPPRSR